MMSLSKSNYNRVKEPPVYTKTASMFEKGTKSEVIKCIEIPEKKLSTWNFYLGQ